MDIYGAHGGYIYIYILFTFHENDLYMPVMFQQHRRKKAGKNEENKTKNDDDENLLIRLNRHI